MTTALYLKFLDEDQANEVLYRTEATQYDEEGTPTQFQSIPRYVNIDTLGILHEPQEDLDSAPIALEGWHVNVLVSDGEDCTPLFDFAVAPTNPRRIWSI
jgi:hypothetical protein